MCLDLKKDLALKQTWTPQKVSAFVGCTFDQNNASEMIWKRTFNKRQVQCQIVIIFWMNVLLFHWLSISCCRDFHTHYSWRHCCTFIAQWYADQKIKKVFEPLPHKRNCCTCWRNKLAWRNVPPQTESVKFVLKAWVGQNFVR